MSVLWTHLYTGRLQWPFLSSQGSPHPLVWGNPCPSAFCSHHSCTHDNMGVRSLQNKEMQWTILHTIVLINYHFSKTLWIMQYVFCLFTGTNVSILSICCLKVNCMTYIPVIVVSVKEYGLARCYIMEGSIDLPHRLGETQTLKGFWVATLNSVSIQGPHFAACIHKNEWKKSCIKSQYRCNLRQYSRSSTKKLLYGGLL